ncbi:MAG: VanZ family protein [Bacteroidales bacterium]|nr:VanZ family protein [Bacteroidales bacterium]
MKIILTNWLAGLYLLLLLVGALIPLGMGSTALSNNYTLHVRADYLLHALFYIPLPAILLLSRWGRKAGWILVIVLSMLVVVLFETVQLLVPYRAFNINDLLANGVGVLIGLFLMLLFRARLSRIIASLD